MADEGNDLVANFMAITGADDVVALQMLEAADFDMEQAVNLFFAAEGGMDAGHAAAASHGDGAGGGGGQPRGGGGGAGARRNSFGDEAMGDDIRAPLPSKVERLYGDHFDPRAAIGAAAAHLHGLSGRPGPPPNSQLDVFRDFRAEAAAAQQAAAAAAAGASGSAGPSAQPGAGGLFGLFRLPADLATSGDLAMAKARAAHESKWLLLNVQSSTEFASHQLNRDTWSHEALKEVLKGTFVFFQVLSTCTARARGGEGRAESRPARTCAGHRFPCIHRHDACWRMEGRGRLRMGVPELGGSQSQQRQSPNACEPTSCTPLYNTPHTYQCSRTCTFNCPRMHATRICPGRPRRAPTTAASSSAPTTCTSCPWWWWWTR